MESDLTKLCMKLEDTQEQVKSVQRVVKVDLRHAVVVSLPRSSLIPWSFVSCLSILAFHFCRV